MNPQNLTHEEVLKSFKQIIKNYNPNKEAESVTSIYFYTKNDYFEMTLGGTGKNFLASIRELVGDKRVAVFDFEFKNDDDLFKVNRVFDSSLLILSNPNKRAQTFIDLNEYLENYISQNTDYSSEDLEANLVIKFLKIIKNPESTKSDSGTDRVSPQDLNLILDAFFRKYSGNTSNQEKSIQYIKQIIEVVGSQVTKDVFLKFMNLVENSSSNQNFDSKYNYSQLLNDEWLAVFYNSRDKGNQTLL